MAMSEFQHSKNVNFVFKELLPQILENLTTSELVKLRLVSRHWKEVSNQILWKRGSIKIQFELDVRSFDCRSRLHTNLENEMKETQSNNTLPDLFRLVTSPQPPETCAFNTSWSLSSSTSLPVNHFGFLRKSFSMEYQAQPDLLSFVQRFGPKLRALTLDSFVPYFVGQPGMPDFLLQYTPNIESLYIRHKHYRRPTDSELQLMQNMNMGGNAKFLLPRLKFIEMDNSALSCRRNSSECWMNFEILQHLLEIAPLLERVSLESVYDLKIVKVFPPSKISLLHFETLHLKDYDLFFEGLENLEYLVEKMMKMDRNNIIKGVGLKYLEIAVMAWPPCRNSWKRGIYALCQILQLNQSSLEEIELLGGAAVIVQKIPGLPALPIVTKLSVDEFYSDNDFVRNCKPEDILDFIGSNDEDEDDDGGGSPSPENSLSHLFPNLDILVLAIGDWVEQGQESGAGKWFPFWNEELRHVRSLQTNHCFDCNYTAQTNVYQKSLQFCPEISTYETGWSYEDFPLKMPTLFSLTQLTSVKLNFELFDDNFTETFVDLDAAITGLSKETVQDIYSNWEKCGRWEVAIKNSNSSVDMETDKEDEDETGQLKRVNSSLLNLHNLKKLQLTFGFDYEEKPRLMISGVSAKFAFDLMKNMEVFICFKCYTGLASCPDCDRKCLEKTEEWLEFHKSLSAFPNVTVKAMK